MERAYLSNPTLNAARAGQRALDESVPQALSGWRPTVTVRGQVATEDLTRSDQSTSNANDKGWSGAGQLDIVLEQPIFRGFGTVERTRAAEARVAGGQQVLLQTEQQVLFDVVRAYMNVYAGRQLVVLLKQDVAALEAQVKAAKSRFAGGEITKTDIDLAQARLAEARVSLVEAQTDLAQNVALYAKVVGVEPSKLTYPPLPKLPRTLKQALITSGKTNPRILAQAFVEDSSFHEIGVARSGLLPAANIRASALSADTAIGEGDTGVISARISADISIPLYEAGLIYSKVREAKQRASQSQIELIAVSRDVIEVVSQTWSAYLGTLEIIKNTKLQVVAAKSALNGIEQEYAAGTRTITDVLDAQRELVRGSALLVNAEKNRIVSAYQLTAAMGMLKAKTLDLKVPFYDPDAYYLSVRDKWIGTSIE